MTPSSFFRAYPSKEALLLELLDHDLEGDPQALALLRRAAAAYPEWPPDVLIAADNVTAAGERLSRRCGLTLRCISDHGSRVYAGPWGAFCAAVGLAAR